MAILFPSSLDSLTNPAPTDLRSTVSLSGKVSDLNDAVEALEAKVGANSSAVTSSHDYKIAQLESGKQATLVSGTNIKTVNSTSLLGSGDISVQAACEEKTGNFTASLGGHYNCTATLTVTDPTPVNGAGFEVFIRNGTVTVGGTAYSVIGTKICRVYHSGAWSNSVYYDSLVIPTATKEPTGFESPESVTITYDGSARTVTLTQSGGVVYWHQGVRYTLTSPWTSDAHDNITSNSYYLQINSGGTITWGTDTFDFQNKGQVAAVRYRNSEWTCLRETHGLMPWQSHFNAHYNIGTYIYSGGALTAGTYAVLPSSPTDADNTPGVDAATVYDEDLPTTIGVWSQGTYTTLRFASSVSTYDTASASLFRVGTTYPRINTGGLSETETSTGQFFNVWGIFVPMAEGTTSQKYRILWMQPQAAFSTSSGAAAESFTSLNIGDLASSFAEYAPRIKVTFATNASWTGATGRCRIHAISYLTGTRASSSLAATTSPGGTNGQVQYNNGGAFGGISEGTSGYVLTSNGAGVAPSFQAATGGSGSAYEFTIQGYEGVAIVGILGKFDATTSKTLAEVTLVCNDVITGTNATVELRKNSRTSGNILSSTLQIATTDTKSNDTVRGTPVTSFTSASIADGDILYAVATWSAASMTLPPVDLRCILRFSA